MTDRLARGGARPLARPPKLELTATGVRGRFRPGRAAVTHVVAVVDGVIQSSGPTLPTGDGAELWFELALPPHLLGGTLDVVAAESGRSILEAPLDLASCRVVHWEAWRLSGRGISGAFRLGGPVAPVAAIVVELRSASGCLGQGYAVPARAAGAYRFKVPFTRLPALGETVAISPVVGGIPVPVRLDVPASAFGYAGYVDPAGRSRVVGWVVDLADPSRAVEVDVQVNGRLVAHGVADRMRPDLQRLGLGDGRSGFLVQLPPALLPDDAVQIAVVVAGTGLNLCNSPYSATAEPPVAGFFDTVEDSVITGWAVNLRDPDSKLAVEAVCDGAVIGSGIATFHRGDVGAAGLPTSACGFHFSLEPPLPKLWGRDVSVRISETGHILPGSPRRIVQNPNVARFLARGGAIRPAVLPRLCRRLTHAARATGVSLIMPVSETPAAWLRESLASVLAQWAANWELICVDHDAHAPEGREMLAAFARRDPRVRVLRAPGKLGLAHAVNLGLRAARGGYVAFLDAGDVIEPDATHKLALAAQRTGAGLIYSDEAITGAETEAVLKVHARPAFSHDFFLSHPTPLHLLCVRTEVARAVAGWDETLAGSARLDFVLRVVERGGTIAHVPSVLYRWRAQPEREKPAIQAALNRHLTRLGTGAIATEGLGPEQYRVDWPDDGREVLIVIPTKDQVDLLAACIASIERTSPGENYRIVVIDHDSTEPKAVRYLRRLARRHTVTGYTGPFNYARMNNEAVRQHAGQAAYFLLLNNDVEAREPGWIARLRSLAARPDVGAVGPLLLYDNDLVQHAGVVVGFAGMAEHAMKLASAYRGGVREPGYCCNLTSVRDYSAVTAACVMIRRDAWERVGGFDEAFEIGFNDTDLCLRLRHAGYRVLYDGYTVLTHRESVTRSASAAMHHPGDDARLRARWGMLFAGGDPFYSPLLAQSGTDHTLRSDPGCKRRPLARAVRISWDQNGRGRA